jgi:hypothetical protein
MSVRKSDKECTASAIIAELWPNVPAMNLKTISATLLALPIRVTLYISFSRVMVSRLGKTKGKNQGVGDSFGFYLLVGL